MTALSWSLLAHVWSGLHRGELTGGGRRIFLAAFHKEWLDSFDGASSERNFWKELFLALLNGTGCIFPKPIKNVSLLHGDRFCSHILRARHRLLITLIINLGYSSELAECKVEFHFIPMPSSSVQFPRFALYPPALKNSHADHRLTMAR